MGAALAATRGKEKVDPKSKVGNAAQSMSEKQLEDFAKKIDTL